MIGTLLLILPFGVVGALSPMMFTEQTLILTTRHGKRAATAYALAAIAVLMVVASALVLLGRSIDLPNDPSLSAWLELFVGVALLVAALVVHRRGDRSTGRHERKPPKTIGVGGAFLFGGFSMLTNYKALALMLPAAKIIVTSGADRPERLILVAALVLVASTPAWLPVVLEVIAPGVVNRVLTAIRHFLEAHGHLILMILLTVLGVFMTIRGAVLVAGL